MRLSAAELRAAIREHLVVEDNVSSDELVQLRGLYERLGASPADTMIDVPTVPDGEPISWDRLVKDAISATADVAQAQHGTASGVEDQSSSVSSASTATGKPPPADGVHVRFEGDHAAGNRASGAPSGGNVFDAPTFAAFVDGRNAERAAETERLAAVRAKFAAEAMQIRERHAAAAMDLLNDESMPASVRASAVRMQRAALARDLAEHDRVRLETCGLERPWIAKTLDRWRAERGVRADYAHALHVLYEDRVLAHKRGEEFAAVKLDATLFAFPGMRRSRVNGGFEYSAPGPFGGMQSVFRVDHERRDVVLRSHSPLALEAAVVRAHESFGPPVVFTGQPAFVDGCRKIAERRGYAYEVEIVAQPPAQTVRPPVPGGRTPAPAATGTPSPPPAAATASGAPIAAVAPPTVDLDDYDDFVETVKERAGIETVVLLDARHTPAYSGIFVGMTPTDDGKHDVVAVVSPGIDVVGMLVVPRGMVPRDAVESVTRIDVDVAAGTWALKASTPAPPTIEPRGRNEDDHGQGRGR